MKNLDRSIFAKNLIAIRKLRGISQRDLAQETGISNRMIAYYETNTVIPPIEKLEKIAKALNVSIGTLVDEDSSDKESLKLDTRILKKVKLLEQLPPEDQRKVVDYIKDLLRKHKLEQQIEDQQ